MVVLVMETTSTPLSEEAVLHVSVFLICLFLVEASHEAESATGCYFLDERMTSCLDLPRHFHLAAPWISGCTSNLTGSDRRSLSK